MGKRIIILDEIVKDLSEITNTSSVLSESFIKSLFTEIAGQLADQGQAEIPGLGRFFIEDGNVGFIADKDIESSLNVAFESFEPVVLDDDFNFDEEPEVSQSIEQNMAEDMKKDAAGDTLDGVDEDLPPAVDAVVSKDVTPVEDAESESQEAEVTLETEVEENVVPEEHAEETQEFEDTNVDDIYDTEEPVKTRFFKKEFWWGVLAGLCVSFIVSIGLNYFVKDTIAEDSTQLAVEDCSSVAMDTIGASVDTLTIENAGKVELSDTVVYKDQYFKVTSAAYLSNVSRKYYGHYAFWIYIYLENKDVIKDPDNIPTGLTLRIPDPKRYGIDKDDSYSVKRAQIKALEYSKGN